MKSGIELYEPVPQKSPLIFSPRKTYEIWRYFTYMFIHIGIIHLAFNVLTQIILGIPLELVHKFWRIALVYLSGVLAGSLLNYAIDQKTYLAGASGGVSHISHFAGFIAGVLMGTIVLRNFRKKNWERVVWWIAVTITCLLFTTLIILNIVPHI
ncbi:unnamed protein product [Gongylonema pulchrum]|uniref:Rhomboid domain-containing protein n=1 Tax=Gongylonema pulchrum TaxID=637853 RepID=A0A183E4D1_9BILA|nr:unnamed protein product [Gongylonema pulchrum]